MNDLEQYILNKYGNSNGLIVNYKSQLYEISKNKCTKLVFSTGDRIKFFGERISYKIMSCTDRFMICVKPFNLQNTVIYTIVDLVNNIRGTENLTFCMGFETQQDCNDALNRLTLGESKISHRNNVSLNIERVIKNKNK